MAIGFVINASTGLALFVSEAADKGVAWIFWLKLSIIAAALVVAAVTRRLVFHGRPAAPTEPVSAAAKALAVASLVLWLGAITAGRLMAYIR